MTYDLRPAADDGRGCTTCKYATTRLDRYGEPLWRCMSTCTDFFVIRNPDETVCDDWRATE